MTGTESAATADALANFEIMKEKRDIGLDNRHQSMFLNGSVIHDELFDPELVVRISE